MDTYTKIDNELKKLNKNRSDLCNETGLSYNTIASLFKRKSENISLEVLRVVAKYLGVSLDYLIYDEIKDSSYGIKKDPTPKREVDLRKEKLNRNYDQLNEAGKSALLDYSNYQLTKNKEDDGETLYVASKGGGVETRHLTREEVEKADKVIEEVLKRAEKEGWGNNNDL